MAKNKKVTVAKGIKLKRGALQKLRVKKGSSSAGKYKSVAKKEFAGKAGGSSSFSFPINTLARARNALARAHYAPNPEGIRKAVYRKYPALKKRAEKRKDPPKKAAATKIHKVMREFKEGTLNIGTSKKRVKNRKQAIAIALSESRKKNKK